MASNFTLPLNKGVEETFEQMQSAVTKVDGNFNGTDKSGEFSIPITLGRIEGSYTMRDGELDVSITKKPFFLTTNKLKKELANFMLKD